jgi:hypothetical protein
MGTYAAIGTLLNVCRPPLLPDDHCFTLPSNSRGPAALPVGLRHTVSAPSLVQHHDTSNRSIPSMAFPSTSLPFPDKSNPPPHFFQIPAPPRQRSVSYQGPHQVHSAATHPHIYTQPSFQADSKRYKPYPSPYTHLIPNRHPTTLPHRSNQSMAGPSVPYDHDLTPRRR